MVADKEVSKFLEVEGTSVFKRSLEVFLEARDFEFAKDDVIEMTGVSRSHLNAIWNKKFIQTGILKKTRKDGNLQLYMLDKKNYFAIMYLQMFDYCVFGIKPGKKETCELDATSTEEFIFTTDYNKFEKEAKLPLRLGIEPDVNNHPYKETNEQ